MKTHLITGLLAFVLGVAVTMGTQWTRKDARKAEASAKPSKSDRKRKSASVPAAPRAALPEKSGKSAVVPTGDGKGAVEKEKLAALKAARMQNFDMEKWQADMLVRIETTGQKEIEARLALWIEKLGLSDGQAKALRDLMEERLAGRITKAEDGGPGALKQMAYGRNAGIDPVLEALLNEVLTPAQQEGYTALQDEQRENQIEARSLRRLADMQTLVDMTSEQRDQVFEVLHQAELTRGEPPQNGKEEYRSFMDAGGTAETWREHHQEVQRVRREDQVEDVSEILNERQLNAYRAFLERRGGGGGAYFYSSSGGKGGVGAIRVQAGKD